MCMLMQNAFEIVSVWVYGCMSEGMGPSEDYLHFPKNKNRVCVTFWLLFFPLPLFFAEHFQIGKLPIGLFGNSRWLLASITFNSPFLWQSQ